MSSLMTYPLNWLFGTDDLEFIIAHGACSKFAIMLYTVKPCQGLKISVSMAVNVIAKFILAIGNRCGVGR